jgi:hypothetical protein
MTGLGTARRVRTILATTAALTCLTATGAVASTSGTAAPAAASCTIQVDNPHNSGHVNGTINVEATVSCSAAVPHIAVFVSLYRDNVKVNSDGKDVYNTAKTTENTATGCELLHYYAATAQAEIWYATGGPKWTNVVNSPTYLWSKCDPRSA